MAGGLAGYCGRHFDGCGGKRGRRDGMEEVESRICWQSGREIVVNLQSVDETVEGTPHYRGRVPPPAKLMVDGV